MSARSLSTLGLTLLAAAGCRDGGVGPAPAGPATAAQSEVSVAATSIASGDTVLLTLTTRDAYGRAITRGGHHVVFQATGGISTGVIGQTTDRGNGSYVATFRGVRSGLATTIGASIDGEPVTRPLPTIRVRPGAFSPEMSTLTVTPRTVLAGGTATLELVTRDAAGNALETGGLQVTLTMAGGSADGVVGPVTDHGDGRYTATFTATRVGSPLSVDATVDGSTVTTPSPTVTVARGISPDLSILTVSSDTVSVNASLRVTLEARDSADVPRTSGGDAVRFFVLGEPGAGEGAFGDVADHDDGTYSATFTATRHGDPISIGVSIDGRPKTTALPSVTILPIPVTAQKSEVSIGADSLEAGESTALVLMLRDLDGEPVTSAASSVRFTMSHADGSSSGTIGPTVEVGDGRYTASFTAMRAGTPARVGVTLGDSTLVQMLDSLGHSHLPTITVVPGSASPDSSLAFADPSFINVRDSAMIRFVARDRYGNVLRQGGSQVTFTRVGGVGVSVGRIGLVTDHDDGTYTAHYLGDSAGTADVIRSAIDGQPVTTAAPSVTVGPACTPGPVSLAVSDVTINDTTLARHPVRTLTLPSGVTTTMTLRLTDSFGCPVPDPYTVAFDFTGGSSTGLLGATVSLGDGVYTATFTGHTSGTATRIAVTVNGTPVTSAPVEVTVVPGDISTRTSLITASATTVAPGASVALTLHARDAAGNILQEGGRSVTFVIAGNDPMGTLSPTIDQGDGTYTSSYVGTQVGTFTIVALIEGTRVLHAVTIVVEST